jgi:hypothetical protein
LSTYPVITAGQPINAALLTSMLPTYIVKQSNTDRTNATFSADPELTTTLVASATYFVEFFLQLGGIPAADIQTRWATPGSASGLKCLIGPGSAALDANADNVATRQGAHLYNTAILYNGVRSATGQIFQAYEYSVLTSGTGGTLSLEWAQGTTNATASRVGAGSLLRVTRLS